MFEMLPQALALVSNSIQRDGCAVENLKIDVSQVNTTGYLPCINQTVLYSTVRNCIHMVHRNYK